MSWMLSSGGIVTATSLELSPTVDVAELFAADALPLPLPKRLMVLIS